MPLCSGTRDRSSPCPKSGIPSQYSRFLEPEEFAGGLTVPISSHVHRLAADGGRVLFGVDDGASDGGAVDDGEGIFLRIGEWDAFGALRSAQSVELERATWQHDIGVTADHLVFIESPTTRLPDEHGGSPSVPFGWAPGAEGWVGVVPRGRRRRRICGCGGALDPPRSLPGDARARRVRRARRGHRPVRLLLRRARGRATRRPLGVRRRRGRCGALGDSGHARRVGAVAHRGRADRASAGGRALCRVSTHGSPLGGCRLPLRLLTRDGLGHDSSDHRSWDRGRGGRAGGSVEIRPDAGRDRVLEPGSGMHPERAALRPGRRWPRRRRGLAAHRGRRPEPWRQRHLRPGRLCPRPERARGGDPPAGRDCRCGATESGCRPTGIADRGCPGSLDPGAAGPRVVCALLGITWRPFTSAWHPPS